jgi:hypothetical protein
MNFRNLRFNSIKNKCFGRINISVSLTRLDHRYFICPFITYNFVVGTEYKTLECPFAGDGIARFYKLDVGSTSRTRVISACIFRSLMTTRFIYTISQSISREGIVNCGILSHFYCTTTAPRRRDDGFAT